MNSKFIFKLPNKVNFKNYRHSFPNNAAFYGLNKKVMLSFQYDEYLTCAIKAGKARTETAARNIYNDCS